MIGDKMKGEEKMNDDFAELCKGFIDSTVGLVEALGKQGFQHDEELDALAREVSSSLGDAAAAVVNLANGAGRSDVEDRFNEWALRILARALAKKRE